MRSYWLPSLDLLTNKLLEGKRSFFEVSQLDCKNLATCPYTRGLVGFSSLKGLKGLSSLQTTQPLKGFSSLIAFALVC
ncbi:hypothetical protein D2C82_08175 (plasmid) [Helicobacter pylori]|uniref:hypothetical protein n=1 Tax=Helicobacter pylori TaxID=210 RepID=UPI0009A2ADD3|nr:hypothetical protein [Helicobacter pylori]OPG23785.1 hypothetical protein BGL56_06265 [Helicobacter pylori]QEF29072.1 hypothetical protein D2C82_08105 [Helicobacter pylori]QEF29081.1 hypothetical protein D2C82_08175 [Helicobacter pylori]